MKRVGILTGGGDVPGLNAAIKAFVWRMLDEPCEIIGLRRGWAALLHHDPGHHAAGGGVESSQQGPSPSSDRRATAARDPLGHIGPAMRGRCAPAAGSEPGANRSSEPGSTKGTK